METPFDVFDTGVFTPNDWFFVRWHWAMIPTSVNAEIFRLRVRGHLNQTLSLSLSDILALPRVELARAGDAPRRRAARTLLLSAYRASAAATSNNPDGIRPRARARYMAVRERNLRVSITSWVRSKAPSKDPDPSRF